jgi:hypothetical protein
MIGKVITPLIQIVLLLSYILGDGISKFNRIPRFTEVIIASVLALIQLFILHYFFRKKFTTNNASWLLALIITIYGYLYSGIMLELADLNFILANLIYFSFPIGIYFLALRHKDKMLLNTNRLVNVGLMLYGGLGLYQGATQLIAIHNKSLNELNSKTTQSTTKKYPNIYLFLLDAYSGERVLRDYFSFDNRPFIDSLKKKGFTYFPDSRSPYSTTVYSMSSFFKMDTITTDLLPTDSEKQNRIRLGKLITQLDTQNPFIDTLKRKGYAIHNYSLFNLGGVKPIYKRLFYTFFDCFWIDSFSNNIYGSILKNISFKRGFRQYFYEPEKVETKIFNDVDSIILASLTTIPHFTYLHSVALHGPLYDVDTVMAQNTFLKDVTTNPGTLNYQDEDNRRYIKSIQSLNSRLSKSINKIISYDKNSIIFIVSDHGYKGFSNELKYYNMCLIYGFNLPITNKPLYSLTSSAIKHISTAPVRYK